MTYEEINEMMMEMNLPYAYHHFAEGESPDPPFLLFLSPRENTFSADNLMYHSFKQLDIELYTDRKSPETSCNFVIIFFVKLNNALVEMGALCEDAISCAVKYLLDRDEQMKESSVKAEKLIDNKEREIESMCMRLLIHQQPVATDFRMVTSVLKMITDLERIGDQASDIVEIADYVTADITFRTDIKEMAENTVRMVTNSIDSFVKKDISIADSVIRMDDTVDALFDKVKSEIMSIVSAESNNAECLLDLLMIAKYFERIGDHSENIAKWVIFAVTGKHNERY